MKTDLNKEQCQLNVPAPEEGEVGKWYLDSGEDTRKDDQDEV
jgi:hypothetical protein